MFRVGIIRENGKIEAYNFETKSEAESWILSIMDREELRQVRIKNLDTNEEEKII